ncbi:MAG: hypothetical protein AAF357_16270 [Verrucomicrobiota bacterium]
MKASRNITSLFLSHGFVFALSVTSVLNLQANETLPERPAGPVTGDNPNIGIKYDEKQGLNVTPFSAKLLGLEKQDVDEQQIVETIQLQAQIFDTSPDKSALASAWLPVSDAKRLKPGTPVSTDKGLIGEITGISTELNEQAEVLLSISDPKEKLMSGKFLSASVALPSAGLVTVVPKEAVVHSAEGSFAYVDNGGWTVRTEIETGAEAEGMVEIVDGLYFGDRIVTKPVMALWMTELQLLKSGKA